MARAKKSNTIGTLLYLALVIGSGALLILTHRAENPVTSINDALALHTMRTDLAAVPTGFDALFVPEGGAPAVDPAPSNIGNTSLRLSEFQLNLWGDVAFDLWFIAAMTALMMMFGPRLGWIIRRIRRPGSAQKTAKRTHSTSPAMTIITNRE
jgi:hypothetical protein